MEIRKKIKEFLSIPAMLLFALLIFVWQIIVVGSGAFALLAVVLFLTSDLNCWQFLLYIVGISVAVLLYLFFKLRFKGAES